MGISDTWSQPLWVVTVEITYKRKNRLWINRLDAPHSFTKTIRHSIIRTWASIDNKQITIQPLTWNFSDHELRTRTLEPFPPWNRKTRANKQRHTKSIWASTSQQQSWSFETRQKQLRQMPTTSYLTVTEQLIARRKSQWENQCSRRGGFWRRVVPKKSRRTRQKTPSVDQIKNQIKSKK